MCVSCEDCVIAPSESAQEVGKKIAMWGVIFGDR
jgi:hypothetical protein